MADIEPVLEVQGLTVRLPAGADRAHAVENVSFAVAPGEIVCVVGESGSGKSVTAHAIMGLLPPRQLVATAGRVLLEGDDLLAKIAGRDAPHPRRPHGDDLPGADDRAQSGHEGRRPDRRSARHPYQARASASGARACST